MPQRAGLAAGHDQSGWVADQLIEPRERHQRTQTGREHFVRGIRMLVRGGLLPPEGRGAPICRPLETD